jgi:putative addiction module killer protein
MFEIKRSVTFIKWLDELKDMKAKSAIRARIERAKLGNFGYWEPCGGEVREMKIDIGAGYRVYYVIQNDAIIFLLCGGNKSTQSADIKKAKKIAKEL